MAKRIVYRVKWAVGDHRWHVRWNSPVGAGLLRADTQNRAVELAVRWAREDLADSRLAQVVVHGKNGRIRFERTYGRDPKRRKG